MNSRLHDWQLRLEVCLAERWARPFEWGVLDCCLFAADCVQAITGIDPAADLRGKYDSRIGAYRILAQAGGFRAMAVSKLGPEITVSIAQVGDIGFMGNDSAGALVVCGGSHWIGMDHTGVVTVPADQVVCAWRCCAC